MRKHNLKPNYYYVQVDSEGYVVAITQTGNPQLDTVELNLAEYNLVGEFIHTYKLVGDKLIQDSSKLAEIVAEQTQVVNTRRVEYLKKLLAESDYITSKWVEELMSLENPLTWVADVIKINVKYLGKYRQLIRDRKSWRDEIRELGGGD